jgi:hypothetical protein
MAKACFLGRYLSRLLARFNVWNIFHTFFVRSLSLTVAQIPLNGLPDGHPLRDRKIRAHGVLLKLPEDDGIEVDNLGLECLSSSAAVSAGDRIPGAAHAGSHDPGVR